MGPWDGVKPHFAGRANHFGMAVTDKIDAIHNHLLQYRQNREMERRDLSQQTQVFAWQDMYIYGLLDGMLQILYALSS